MIILGLDPSTKAVGWALLEAENDTLLNLGVIRAEHLDKFCGETLLYFGSYLINQIFVNPTLDRLDVVACERPIQYKNADTTYKLGQVFGMIHFLALQWTDTFLDIVPSERLTWLGLPGNLPRKMAKEQVTRLVNLRYSLDLTPEDHDAADALAVALAGWCKIQREMMT